MGKTAAVREAERAAAAERLRQEEEEARRAEAEVATIVRECAATLSPDEQDEDGDALWEYVHEYLLPIVPKLVAHDLVGCAEVVAKDTSLPGPVRARLVSEATRALGKTAKSGKGRVPKFQNLSDLARNFTKFH